jgi:polysaccharide pyruvyl transferase WcaK-like protein
MQERHGIAGCALCCTSLPYYYMSGKARQVPRGVNESRQTLPQRLKTLIKNSVPRLWGAAKSVHFVLSAVPREICHFWSVCRHLRSQNLLLISGGGQIDDEWGGAWGHPYALLKWTLAAWLFRVPVAFASVGVCRLEHRASRIFIGLSLRLATYRSFRDKHSRDIVTRVLGQTRDDPIVPDLAFAMPQAALPAGGGYRRHAQGRRVVALSPISFARPEAWPTEDIEVYSRYLSVMKALVISLLERDCFVLFVWSSLGPDQTTLSDMLDGLPTSERLRLQSQSATASIENWPDFIAAVQDADLLIASRLHSVILSLLVCKPVIAISFDPKVDWLMEDAKLTDYLLNIRDFTVQEVIAAIGCIEAQQARFDHETKALLKTASQMLTEQFDHLVTVGK